MFKRSPQITHSGTLRRAQITVLLAGLAAAFFASAPGNAAAQTNGYNWPVKPFDHPHAVRGNLVDPRMTFNGPQSQNTVLAADGIFQLHFGIDISAPDGTAVYAVRSGVASLPSGRTVAVDSGGGSVFEYWHIVPSITAGRHVVAFKTVLGHVMKGYEHVHFTERDHGVALNPLAPGHLTPYADDTTPTVGAILFRTSETGPDLDSDSVHGRVVVIAEASDTPPLSLPGRWSGLPVTPARLTWSIDRAYDGKTIVGRRVTFDAREQLPRITFWDLYARGSRQNAPNYGGHKAFGEPGIYLYKLSPTALDTTAIPNGRYHLVATVTDVRGNTSSTRQTFEVRNGEGS